MTVTKAEARMLAAGELPASVQARAARIAQSVPAVIAGQTNIYDQLEATHDASS